jgi:DNA polymerase sigma
MHGEYDVSFCHQIGVARSWLKQQGSSDNLSIGQLLSRFFSYYVNGFDLYHHVISVHSNDNSGFHNGLFSKESYWADMSQRKYWRISIADPFETSRDLGSVLSPVGQQRLLEEFHRASLLMGEEGDGADVDFDRLCELKMNKKSSGKNVKKGETRNTDKCEVCGIFNLAEIDLESHLNGAPHQKKVAKKQKDSVAIAAATPSKNLNSKKSPRQKKIANGMKRNRNNRDTK